MQTRNKNNNATFSGSYTVARCAFAFILLSFVSLETIAQLRVYPVQRRGAITKQQNIHARTQSVTPLSLPFFDDFSFTPVDKPADTLSNYPLPSLWVGSQNVWVSSGIGINPPSINVASFDGLDSLGLPYSDIALSSGFCDTLVSAPIKLGEPAVAVAERGTVWLSFQYQWYGNGEPPDANDYLQISFKDNTGTWIPVMDIVPRASLDRTVFYDTIVQVSSTPFFHDNFQFKFENRGRKTGPFDTWNIDYIYLNKGRTISSKSFPDRTAASGISPLFEDYYAIPIKHLDTNMDLDTPAFDIKIMRSEPGGTTFGYSVDLNIKNYKNGVLTELNDALIDSITTSVVIPQPLQRFTQEFDVLPDLSDNSLYKLDSDSIEIGVKAYVNAGDKVEPSYGNVDFRKNDAVSTKYYLNNYYAYDDGSAEYAAGNSRAGDKFAYAFDMLTPDADTLAGFYAYFPEYALNSNRLINIHIYKDNNGFPQDLPVYSIPSYTVKKKDINEFQFVRIIEPIVVTDRFYIGFESLNVRIGLDMSHDTGDRIFENVNTVWSQSTEVHGALMIRPVFGEGFGQGPITGIPEEKTISIYPNPNKGQFFIHGHATLLEAYSITGRRVEFSTEEFGDSQQVTLQSSPAGMYLLKMKQENKVVTHKIVIY